MLSFLCFYLARSSISFCSSAWEGFAHDKGNDFCGVTFQWFDFALIFCLNSILIAWVLSAPKAAACWFTGRVKVDVLILWVFVLPCLETKGPLSDNVSPKVLLHCIKSGGSDRCFLSCSPDVQVFSGKSELTKLNMCFYTECRGGQHPNSQESSKKQSINRDLSSFTADNEGLYPWQCPGKPLFPCLL